MADENAPTFAIAERPTRQYPRGGGVEYDGGTVFSLRPDPAKSDESLTRLVKEVLGRSGYRYGDWFDLPMPLYLVHDDHTGDTFRVGIRDGAVELYVLPTTEPAGLRAFYERLLETAETEWDVLRRTD